MRKLFLFVISLLQLSSVTFAQNEIETYSRGGFFEQVYDQSGNSYNLMDLQIEPNKASSRGGGGLPPCVDLDNYFEVFYDEGSGFESPTNTVHQQRRELLCKVLSDLSRFVVPVNPSTPVRLRIRPYIQTTENVGVLAAASSYLAYPIGFSNTGGIIDNLVWKTINSGNDAYFDIANVILSNDPSQYTMEPGYYHGEIYVNFYDEDEDASTNNLSPIHWNLDHTASPSQAEFDLYSVLLHEMFHALGFSSSIKQDGTGYAGTHYTRYDKFLRTPDVAHPEGNLPLIYSDGEPCQMYWHEWNSDINTERIQPSNPSSDFDLTSVGPPSTCDPDINYSDFFITNCYNAIHFVGSIDIPVFTPLCFRDGGSLSHLEDQCVPGVTEYEHYLMAAGFPSGVMRRFPQSEERSILCDLGYQMNDHFGFASNNIDDDGTYENEMIYSGGICGGAQIVGMNDGISDNGQFFLYTEEIGDTLVLFGNQLLSNDVVENLEISTLEDVSFECFESVIGNTAFTIDGNAATTSGDLSSVIEFYNNGNPGMCLFRYVPKYGDIYGNITYVFMYFSGDSASNNSSVLYNIDNCIPGTCNLLNNGNFEEDSEWCSHTILAGPPGSLTCWNGMGPVLAKPIYFSRTIQIDTTGCTIGLSTNTNTLMSTSPAMGIESNTGTLPPTSSAYPTSNGIVLLTARHSSNPVSNGIGRRSAKLLGTLSMPLVPLQQYKLSYNAKVYYAAFDSLDCQLCNTYSAALPLYGNTNKPAFPRFLISNIAFSYGAGNGDIPINTVDWEDSVGNLDGLDNVYDLSTWSTNPPLAIEPIGDNPTDSSDWHYREFIFTVPDSANAGFSYLIIDYDIWLANYENTAVGYFLDDVTLQPYFGDVISLPDEVCFGSQIENLIGFNNYPSIEGSFTCPNCPEGTLGVDSNSFNSEISGPGDFQVIFTYENSQGCDAADIQNIHVKPIQECCEIQFNSQYLMTDCDPALSLITVSPQTYLDNVNMQMTNDQYLYEWQSDVDFEPTGPFNDQYHTITADNCGLFDVIVTDTINHCVDTVTIETICPVGPMQVSYTIDHGICNLDDSEIDVTVTNGSGDFSFNWYTGGNLVNPIATTEDLDLDDSGVYSFTVQDLHCSNTYNSGTIVIEADHVDFNVDINQACEADAEICVNVVNGVSPFSYTINDIVDVDGCVSGISGLYHIIVTDNLGCISDSMLNIQTGAGISSEIVLPNSCVFAVGDVVSFGNNSIEPGIDYFWSFGDGFTDTIQNPLHSYSQSGIFEVELLISSSNCNIITSVELAIVDVVETGPILITTQSDADFYTNLWNNQFVMITDDIEFGLSDGSESILANFEGVVFWLAEGVDIIVNESVELFFDHCDFTACRNWNGIALRSDGTTAEIPAVVVMNDCLVEYANKAIYTTDLSHDGEFQEGGIFHLENCDFRNNLISIEVESANAPIYELSYEQRNGSFYTAFSLDDAFTGRFDEPFENIVRYNHTKTYNFFSCDFSNSIQTVSEWSERGAGIHAYNANFILDDEDTENADAELSRFTGFDMAIDISISNGEYNHPIIRETDFVQNRIAIYNLNVCFQRIIKNDIIVGEATGVAALDEQEIDHEGIVLDGGGFYRVSSNEVIGDVLNPNNFGKTIGIRIRDNVSQGQEVNNNEVHNCDYAMLANGNNRVNDSGLRYVCNQMSDNGTDIFVGEFPSSGFAADISKWQSDLGSFNFLGSEEKAAGNTFTPNLVDLNFVNNPIGSEIRYLYFVNGINELPSVSGLTYPQFTIAGNECLLEFVDQYPMDDDSVHIINSEKIAGLKNEYLNYKYLYHAIIDNGNTEAMLELIENSWSEGIWQTRASLLDGSPYLSDETLRKVADAMPEFPYLVALEIYLANPTVTSQSTFVLYLKSTTDMPDEMIDLVANNTSQAVLRAELEENLAKTHMRLIDELVFRIHYSLDHVITGSYDMSQDLIDSETILGNWIMIDYLIGQKQLEDAQELCLSTRDRIYFSKLDIRDEAEAMDMWLGVIENNPQLENLAGTDLNTIQYLQSNFYFTTAGKKASSILREYFDEDHFTPAYYQNSSSTPRSMISKVDKLQEDVVLSVYPNPANDFIVVKWSMFQNSQIEIQLLDMTGKVLMVQKASNEVNQLIIDTKSFPNGLYVLSLMANKRQISTEKFEINH